MTDHRGRHHGAQDPMGQMDDETRATFRAERLAVHERMVNGLIAAKGQSHRRTRRRLVVLACAAVACFLGVTAAVGFLTGGDATETLDVIADAPDADASDASDPDAGDPTIPAEPTATATTGPIATAAPAVVAPTPTPTPTIPAQDKCTWFSPDTVDALNPYIVLGLGADDPDGGLVAHQAAGADEPVTRVIPADGVVTVAGRCTILTDGSGWVAVEGPQGLEWVNNAWLAGTDPACLFNESESNGTATYDPVDGRGTPIGETIGFVSLGADTWTELPDNNRVGALVPCYLDGPAGPACATGATVELVNLGDPALTRTVVGPIELTMTGRLWAPIDRRGLAAEQVEVKTPDGHIGFVAPGAVESGECELASEVAGGAAADATSLPCAVAADADVGLSIPHSGVHDSGGHYLHDVETLTIDGCVRVIVTLGRGYGTGELADDLPDVSVTSTGTETTVEFPVPLAADFAVRRESGSGGTTALITRQADGDPFVWIGHPFSLAGVSFLEASGQVVVDLRRQGVGTGLWSGPVDGPFVLRSAMQTDLNGPGLPAGEPIAVRGFGRPFEGTYEWRVYQWDPAASPIRTDDLPELYATAPMLSGFDSTTDYLASWGQFTAVIPALAEGTYVVVVGETDAKSGTFSGTGQVIRIDDPATPETEPLIEAQVLPPGE